MLAFVRREQEMQDSKEAADRAKVDAATSAMKAFSESKEAADVRAAIEAMKASQRTKHLNAARLIERRSYYRHL